MIYQDHVSTRLILHPKPLVNSLTALLSFQKDCMPKGLQEEGLEDFTYTGFVSVELHSFQWSLFCYSLCPKHAGDMSLI